MKFSAVVEPDGEGWVVTIPGMPGATDGDTQAEAYRRAGDMLWTTIAGLMHFGDDVPTPKILAGYPTLELSPVQVAKVALYTAAREQGVSQREVGRRLGKSPAQASRLFDPWHNSRIDQMVAALAAVGKSATLTIEDVA